MSTPAFFLFLGPQGSGKGTQLELLNQRFGLPVVVMGEVLRTEAATGTELGRRIAALIDQGTLVTIDLWEAALEAYLVTIDVSRGLMADGLLRTMEQVNSFERIQAKLGLSNPLVLNIQLPRDVSIDRLLKRGRHDDTREAIESRLAWSESDVLPVIDHYRAMNQVIDLNGDQTIEAVHAEILEKLQDRGVHVPGENQ